MEEFKINQEQIISIMYTVQTNQNSHQKVKLYNTVIYKTFIAHPF